MSNFIRSFTPKNHGGHLSTHKYLPPRAFQIWGFFLDFNIAWIPMNCFHPFHPFHQRNAHFKYEQSVSWSAIWSQDLMSSTPYTDIFHESVQVTCPLNAHPPKEIPRMPGFLTIYPLHYSRHLSLFRCRRNESLWKLKYYKQFWCRVKVVHDAWSAFNTLRLLDPGALASKHHSSH